MTFREWLLESYTADQYQRVMAAYTDPNQQTELYDAVVKVAQIFAQRHGDDYQTAEDFAQDIAMKLFRAIQRGIGPRSESIPGWLKVTMQHTISNRARKKRSVTAPPDFDFNSLPTPPSEKDQSEERKLVLRRLVSQLEDPYKTTAILFYYQGLTMDQIAIQTGTPLGTVKRRLFDIRNMLRSDPETRNVA